MSRNRELKQIIDALNSFGKSASHQEEELRSLTQERDSLLSELSNLNGRVVELENQLSASLKASESMRHAMEMAEDESRRWHEQCNALLQTLHTYSTPPKASARPSTSRTPRHEEHSAKSSRSALSQVTTKVEEESEVDDSFLHRRHPQMLVGDYTDPRRRAYPQGEPARRSKALLEHGESEMSVETDDVYEESEDELNGLDSNYVEKSNRTPKAHTSSRATKERMNEPQSSTKKRKQSATTGGSKKIKR